MKFIECALSPKQLILIVNNVKRCIIHLYNLCNFENMHIRVCQYNINTNMYICMPSLDYF